MTSSPPTVLRYLADHVHKLARHPSAEEAWDELENALASVEAAVDTKPSAKYAGRCEVCGRDIYAEPGSDVATCRPCGVDHKVDEQWAGMLEQIADRLVRSSEAARIIPTLSGLTLERSDVDRWHSRHQLTPHGRDERGRPLFRVSEIIDLARRSPRRRDGKVSRAVGGA